MKRQGHGDPSEAWVLRWVQLHADHLCYFAHRGDTQPRKDLPLLDCVDVEVGEVMEGTDSQSTTGARKCGRKDMATPAFTFAVHSTLFGMWAFGVATEVQLPVAAFAEGP